MRPLWKENSSEILEKAIKDAIDDPNVMLSSFVVCVNAHFPMEDDPADRDIIMFDTLRDQRDLEGMGLMRAATILVESKFGISQGWEER